jgi:hypothetical protein
MKTPPSVHGTQCDVRYPCAIVPWPGAHPHAPTLWPSRFQRLVNVGEMQQRDGRDCKMGRVWCVSLVCTNALIINMLQTDKMRACPCSLVVHHHRAVDADCAASAGARGVRCTTNRACENDRAVFLCSLLAILCSHILWLLTSCQSLQLFCARFLPFSAATFTFCACSPSLREIKFEAHAFHCVGLRRLSKSRAPAHAFR